MSGLSEITFEVGQITLTQETEEQFGLRVRSCSGFVVIENELSGQDIDVLHQAHANHARMRFRLDIGGATQGVEGVVVSVESSASARGIGHAVELADVSTYLFEPAA